MAGRSYPFAIGQSTRLIKNPTGWPAASIGGDNPTRFYLHLPGLAPGWQWVFPYTYGFMYPITPPSLAPVTVTTKDTPPGFPDAGADTATATLALFDDAYPPSVGFRPQAPGAWVLVGTKTLAAGVDQIITSPLPPATKTIAIVNQTGGAGGPTPGSNYVKGNVTGTIYLAWTGAGPAQQLGAQLVAVNAAADPTVQINWSAGGGFLVAIYATELSIPTAASQGQQTMGYSLPVVIAKDQSAVTTVPANFFVYGPIRYDGQGFSGPAAGTKATVTLAANATQRWVAHAYGGAQVQVAGAAVAHNISLIDGVSGGAAVLDMDKSALTATAATADRGNPRTGRAFANSAINTALTCEFDVGTANTTQVVHLGAYLQ